MLPATNDEQQQQQLLDLLVAIADRCGFFADDGDARTKDGGGDSSCAPRLKFIQTVSHLFRIMGQAEFDNNNHSPSMDDDDSLHRLLEMEETIAGVRRDADSFLSSLAQDQSELMLLQDELLEMGAQSTTSSSSTGSDDLSAWVVWGRSLVSQFRWQCRREDELVRQLQAKLDTNICYCYSEAKTDTILQRTIHCLRREQLLGQVPFREGVNILLQRHHRQDSTTSGRGSSSQSSASNSAGMLGHPPPSLGLQQPKQFAGGTATLGMNCVGQATTAWDVFQEFQRSSHAFVFSILIVGPEGSGKTHLCNKMEQAVPPSTMGKFKQHSLYN